MAKKLNKLEAALKRENDELRYALHLASGQSRRVTDFIWGVLHSGDRMKAIDEAVADSVALFADRSKRFKAACGKAIKRQKRRRTKAKGGTP